MFLRLLVGLALLFAAWSLVRPRAKAPPAARAGGDSRDDSHDAARTQARIAAEPIVDCRRCGVHFPSSEALRDKDSHAYCCAEHRAAGPAG